MGFLGVGKTTAILQLLADKARLEKWAVLVNEFGVVGIDGAIYASQGSMVKEVPGGCMCCAAGVPMQVAVNRLLRDARPDRLLIEPSGLGHPRRVLETLDSEYFRGVLDLRASLCLVDPRKLGDSRYCCNENFVDQIAMADVLIANKVDLADAHALALFGEWAVQSEPAKQVVAQTVQARLNRAWLDLPRNPHRKARYSHHHISMPGEQMPDESRSKKAAMHHSDGHFHSCGWVFPGECVFDYSLLYSEIVHSAPLRLKGVISTDRGWFLFNYSDGLLTVSRTGPCPESRIELIHTEDARNEMEDSLRKCLKPL